MGVKHTGLQRDEGRDDGRAYEYLISWFEEVGKVEGGGWEGWQRPRRPCDEQRCKNIYIKHGTTGHEQLGWRRGGRGGGERRRPSFHPSRTAIFPAPQSSLFFCYASSRQIKWVSGTRRHNTPEGREEGKIDGGGGKR